MKNILLSLILLSVPCFAEAPKAKIATINQAMLTQKVGYQEMRELENSDTYRDALRDISSKIADYGKKLVEAKNDEDLERINLELGFLRKKQQAIQLISSSNANRGNDRAVLTDLIISNFKDKFPIIIYDQGNGYRLSNAIHQNIEEVDITDQVVALVKATLAGTAPPAPKAE